jgi:hypothetical protein
MMMFHASATDLEVEVMDPCTCSKGGGDTGAWGLEAAHTHIAHTINIITYMAQSAIPSTCKGRTHISFD